MAFIVEDGTGLPDATSLVSVAFADDYFSLRQKTGWTALDEPAKQGHLVIGTDYLSARWPGGFRSQPVEPDQALPFPRVDFGMPKNMLHAVCEYAYQSAFGRLYNEMTTDSSGVATFKTKEKLGPMEETFAAVPGAVARTFRRFPMADNLMSPFLIGMGAGAVYR